MAFGQVLIEAGADPLACDPVGQVSTLHAAVTGDMESEVLNVDAAVINYLIDKGTDGIKKGGLYFQRGCGRW